MLTAQKNLFWHYRQDIKSNYKSTFIHRQR